jgi:hypothetical protein
VLVLAACKKSGSPTNSSPGNGPGNNSGNTPIGNGQPPASTGVGVPVGSPASKTIGSAGGSLYSPDSTLLLTIPAGALSANTNISIQPVTNLMPGGLGLAYDLLPNGTRFTVPVTISFRYTTDEVPDNFPYFLNIAYQDSNHVWQGDLQKRYFDTVAHTVSLDVSHFTTFAFDDGISIEAYPTTLVVGQSSSLTINETVEITTTGGNTVSAEVPIDNSVVGTWSVNGIAGGNSTVGTVSGNGANAVYQAPAQVDHAIQVQVRAVLKMTEIFLVHGKLVTIKNPTRTANITVLPFKEYDFTVRLYYYDSTQSTFYGDLKGGALPVYYDHAEFDVHLVAKPTKPEISLGSTPQNFAPTMTPSSAIDGNSVYSWIADPYGEMDVSGVSLGNGAMITSDSIVTVFVTHGHAYIPGGKLTLNGTPLWNTAPMPFTGGVGVPPTFNIELKKTPPYFNTIWGGGKSITSAILPKQ